MNDKDYLVSVIIPIYNVEAFLPQCIDSVINQTYKNLEIILVDDGSPDSCPLICDEYARKDTRIKVLHKVNGGLSDARNTGFEIATGKYVYFLDSDDYLVGTAVEELLVTAEREQADFVFFDALNFYDESDSAEEFNYSRGKMYEPNKGYIVLEQLISSYEYWPMAQLNFILADYVRGKKLNFYKGIVHEDELYTYLLFLNAKRVAHVNRDLYMRRVRENSIMTSEISAKNFIGCYTVFMELLKLYDEKNPLQQVRELLRHRMRIMFLYCGTFYYDFSRNDKKKVYREKKRLFEEIKRVNFLYSKEIKLAYSSLFLHRLYKKTANFSSDSVKNYFKDLMAFKGQRTVLRSIKINKKQKNIIYIGAPTHGNLGDHAIAIAGMQLLNDYFPDYKITDIPFWLFSAGNLVQKRLKRKIGECLICITGGGYLGTLWIQEECRIRNIVSTFSANKIVFFPLTAFYSDDKHGRNELVISQQILNAHGNLYMCARDKTSYDILNENYTSTTVLLTPDIVTYLTGYDNTAERDGILLCIRRDRESVINDEIKSLLYSYAREHTTNIGEIDTVVEGSFGPEQRKAAVEIKLSEFGSARLVITDRLHGMLFSAITGTRCVAINNMSKKVEGAFEWIKRLPYVRFAENIDSVPEYINELLQIQDTNYSNEHLVMYYNQIAEIIRKALEND